MIRLLIAILVILFLKINLSFGDVITNIAPAIVKLNIESVGTNGFILKKERVFPGEVATIGIPVFISKNYDCIKAFGQENIEHKSHSEIFLKGVQADCDSNYSYDNEILITTNIEYFLGKLDGYKPDEVTKIIKINEKFYEIKLDTNNEKVSIEEKNLNVKLQPPFDEVPIKTIEIFPYLKEIRNIKISY